MENFENEIWKDIPNFKGYQASNLGRIRTYNKTTYTSRHGERHWVNRVLKIKFCKNQKNPSRKDGRVELWRDGKHFTKLVARLVVSAFYGESDLTVNHINGNSMDNRIENLEYTTLKENIQKGFQTGLYKKSCKQIQLTNNETQESKTFYSLEEAGRYMGFKHGYLCDSIKRGKFANQQYSWKMVE